MTAVRRLLIIACVASALPLFARRQKDYDSTPQPATVRRTGPQRRRRSPGRSGSDRDVSADTDQDAEQPRALMRLSLDEAIGTAMLKQNIGMQIQRYEPADVRRRPQRRVRHLRSGSPRRDVSNDQAARRRR